MIRKSVVNKVCEARSIGALNYLMDIVYDNISEDEVLTRLEKSVAYIAEQLGKGMVNG